jgi:2-dehydro-3-deoxygalactonokinase
VSDDQTALVAVDWGTSSLRAARLDAQGQVLEERALTRGIMTIPANGFAPFFEATFANWTRAKGVFYLISGMAGSKQGWKEAPYCPCPAGFDEVAAALTWIEPQRIAIVPGLRCEHAHAPDVMRGEEVQIFGAMQLTGLRDGLFVLPGTHSKWVQVQNGCVTTFKTYMTGEFYALLSQHSILAKNLVTDAPFAADAFAQGVTAAQTSSGLLHAAFSARTLFLFSRISPSAVASYLSGLVIGEELRLQFANAAGAAPVAGRELVLIGSGTLTARYSLALALQGVRSRTLGSEATWAGLHALAGRLKGTAA